MDEQIINIGLYISYALLVVAVLGVIAGLILGLAQDLKSGMYTIGAIVAMLVIFFIAYSISDAELTQKLITKGFTASHLKMFTGGLVTFYVLFIIAWAGLLFDLVKNLIQGN